MTKRNKIIIAIIISLAILIAAIFAWQTYKRVSSLFKFSEPPSTSFKQPAETIPETNPFEQTETNPFEKVETNPFKDVYKNPFAE